MAKAKPEAAPVAESSKKETSEELFDTVMRVLKKNHNWKFFLGIIVAWLILALI